MLRDWGVSPQFCEAAFTPSLSLRVKLGRAGISLIDENPPRPERRFSRRNDVQCDFLLIFSSKKIWIFGKVLIISIQVTTVWTLFGMFRFVCPWN